MQSPRRSVRGVRQQAGPRRAISDSENHPAQPTMNAKEEGGRKFTVLRVELRSEIGPWLVHRRLNYHVFH